MQAAVYFQNAFSTAFTSEDATSRTAGLIVAVLLHAAAADWLLEQASSVPPVVTTPPAPVMVELITPAPPAVQAPPPARKPPEVVKPKIEPPKPKPKRAQPAARRAPVISRQAEVPDAPAAEPAPKTAAAPVQTAAPQSAPVPAPAPAPAPVSPPNFNADYLNNPAPAYPSLSRSQGEQGRVLLRVLVDADGAAERVEVRSSSGYSRLDESARETVKRWRFVPARQGSQTVSAWVLVPISFSLEG